MKIGVTGASGHIGSEVCKQLLQAGHQVRALVHRDTKAIDDLPLEKMQGDVLSPPALADFMENCDAIIHAGAIIALGYHFVQEVYDVNVIGTRNVLYAAMEAGIKKMVHFSSIHVFDQQPYDVPVVESRCFVSDNSLFYDKTKRDGHLLALDAFQKGLNVVVVCPTGVLGPPDFRPSKLGKAVVDIYSGSVPAVVKGGFDFVDVRDVALGAVAALDKGKSGETYILSGHYFSIKAFAELIFKVKGSQKKLLELPLWVVQLGLPFIKAYAAMCHKEPLYDKTYLDILRDGNQRILSTKAKLELGYYPRPMEVTLTDTINWFLETGKIK